MITVEKEYHQAFNRWLREENVLVNLILRGRPTRELENQSRIVAATHQQSIKWGKRLIEELRYSSENS